MKTTLVLATLVAVACAQYPDSVSNSRYLPPSQPSRDVGGSDGYDNQEVPYVKKVYRHVYVHEAPEEQAEHKSNVIRVPGGDKHVNIIFVKTPSSSSQSETEVILPEQDEHKNLVYVLLKKSENNSNVKITRPQPQAPSKPEVNFIRYSQPQQPQQPSDSYGPPSNSNNEISAPTPVLRNVSPPRNTYGADF